MSEDVQNAGDGNVGSVECDVVFFVETDAEVKDVVDADTSDA